MSLHASQALERRPKSGRHGERSWQGADIRQVCFSYWSLLERAGVDVCVKDPGFAVDLVCRGNIGDFVAIHLGHARWRDVAGKALSIEADRRMAKQLPAWLRLDKVVGRDFPVVRPAA
jgi:hypothetical protein